MKSTYNLSPLQEGILFHSIVEPNTGVYITQWQCAVREPLDEPKFKEAWEHVIARHEILRTHFEWKEKEAPVQIVDSEVDFRLIVQDWSDMPANELQARLEDFLADDRSQGIQLNEPPLFRVSCFITGTSEFRFIWTYHHIIADGSTGRLIFEDLFTIYHALTENRPFQLLALPAYVNYIEWLENQNVIHDMGYWRSVLKGFSSPNRLPEIHQPLRRKFRKVYATESLTLDRSLTSSLKKMAADNGFRLNSLIQAAWSLIGDGPRCLDRLRGRISSELVFGFQNFI